MTDFLNKINDVKIIQEDAILVAMDVRSLYGNIKHNEEFLALEEHLNKRITRNFPTKEITLIQHILTLNNLDLTVDTSYKEKDTP